MEDPDFKKPSKSIVKQLEVTEYQADVYYNSKTGERIHAEFPCGIVDDVNYGGSVKAFLFLLNHDCCTSIDKSSKFLSDLTEGKPNLSKGMVIRLSREFACKTEQERRKIFSDLLLSPVMHTDCTNAKVNGASAYVFICASLTGRPCILHVKKGARRCKGNAGGDIPGNSGS